MIGVIRSVREGVIGNGDDAVVGAVVVGSEGGGVGGSGGGVPVGECTTGDGDVGLNELCGGV